MVSPDSSNRERTSSFRRISRRRRRTVRRTRSRDPLLPDRAVAGTRPRRPRAAVGRRDGRRGLGQLLRLSTTGARRARGTRRRVRLLSRRRQRTRLVQRRRRNVARNAGPPRDYEPLEGVADPRRCAPLSDRRNGSGPVRPSSSAGVRNGIRTVDCRFVASSIVDDLFGANGAVRRSIDALVAGRGDTPAVGGPRERYERGKRPMAKLSWDVLEDVDPDGVGPNAGETTGRGRRSSRRETTSRSSSTPSYRNLPQVVPVRADHPEGFLAELEACAVDGVHTWPRLSSSVLDDPDYDTARRLSREIVTLPVHQQIDPRRSSMPEIDWFGDFTGDDSYGFLYVGSSLVTGHQHELRSNVVSQPVPPVVTPIEDRLAPKLGE